MISEPSVDGMIRKLGKEDDPISRYALCTIAAERARQIIETQRNLGVTALTGKDKELLSACKDIAEGKVVVAKD
jgi:DNA-directed RNA polymerase omega subunit